MPKEIPFFDTLSPTDQAEFRKFQKFIYSRIIDAFYDHGNFNEKQLLDLFLNYQISEPLKIKLAFSIEDFTLQIARAHKLGLPKHEMIQTVIEGIQQ